MEPKRGSVCVVARLTNRVSLHFEPTYIIRERSNRSTGFFVYYSFFSFFPFFFHFFTRFHSLWKRWSRRETSLNTHSIRCSFPLLFVIIFFLTRFSGQERRGCIRSKFTASVINISRAGLPRLLARDFSTNERKTILRKFTHFFCYLLLLLLLDSSPLFLTRCFLYASEQVRNFALAMKWVMVRYKNGAREGGYNYSTVSGFLVIPF